MANSKELRGIDVYNEISNAIKGLKAIQREAKKATRALREYEKAMKDVNSNE
jgi:hypothetical protein